jgi:hypothetical protein
LGGQAYLKVNEKRSVSNMADIVERLTKWRDDPEDLRDEPESAALLMAEAALQISMLRLAIRRLAEQDATLSVCNGNVTVTMDAVD